MLSWFWEDRSFTDTASGSELVVEVFDAVDHVSVVDGKRDAVQALATHDAAKTVRMIGFTSRSQDPIQNGSMADTALFQCVLFPRIKAVCQRNGISKNNIV